MEQVIIGLVFGTVVTLLLAGFAMAISWAGSRLPFMPKPKCCPRCGAGLLDGMTLAAMIMSPGSHRGVRRSTLPALVVGVGFFCAWIVALGLIVFGLFTFADLMTGRGAVPFLEAIRAGLGIIFAIYISAWFTRALSSLPPVECRVCGWKKAPERGAVSDQ